MATNRYTLVLVAALATAGAATFGVYRLIENTKSQSQVVLRPVVVANQDVMEGMSLERVALAVAQWPAAAVPPGAFASLDSVVGRVSRVAIFKGEAIVPGRLAPAGTGPGIQVKITPGKRAMAVRIDDVAGVSGLIQPDSRVDVIVTLRDEAAGNQVSKLFMSNMRVLSVGTVVASGPDNRPINATTVTLEVFPDEAEQLSVAMREGPIQLMLRGYGDPDSIKTRGARSGDVLGQLRGTPTTKVVEQSGEVRRVPRRTSSAAPSSTTSAPAPTAAPVSAAPVAPKKPDSLTIQIYRGDKASQQKFEKSDSTKKKPDVP